MAQGSNIKNPKIKQKQSLFCKEIILRLLCTFFVCVGMMHLNFKTSQAKWKQWKKKMK